MKDESSTWKPVVTILVAIISCIGAILSASWMGDVVIKPLFADPTIAVQPYIETSVAATITTNNQGFSPGNVINQDATEQYTLEQSQHLTPTPMGIRNPSGVIPAGKTIIVNDMALVVEDSYSVKVSPFADLVGNATPYIHIELIVQNLSGRTRLFSWIRPESLILKDDLGNVYNPVDTGPSFYRTLQVSLDSGDTQHFSSSSGAGFSAIPIYEGPIAPGASQIIIEFNGFGPFSGFEVSIDL